MKCTTSTIDMPYSPDDLLLCKGIAGQYSTIVTDMPFNNKTITFNFVLYKDADGSNYSTVKISTQTWLAENLKTTHFVNGTPISLVIGNSNWNALIITTKAYFCYNDDSATYANTYGTLCTWAAVMNGAANRSSNPSVV